MQHEFLRNYSLSSLLVFSTLNHPSSFIIIVDIIILLMFSNSVNYYFSVSFDLLSNFVRSQDNSEYRDWSWTQFQLVMMVNDLYVCVPANFLLFESFLPYISGVQARYVWAQVCVDFNLRAESGQLVESTESPCWLHSRTNSKRPK